MKADQEKLKVLFGRKELRLSRGDKFLIPAEMDYEMQNLSKKSLVEVSCRFLKN